MSGFYTQGRENPNVKNPSVSIPRTHQGYNKHSVQSLNNLKAPSPREAGTNSVLFPNPPKVTQDLLIVKPRETISTYNTRAVMPQPISRQYINSLFTDNTNNKTTEDDSIDDLIRVSKSLIKTDPTRANYWLNANKTLNRLKLIKSTRDLTVDEEEQQNDLMNEILEESGNIHTDSDSDSDSEASNSEASDSDSDSEEEKEEEKEDSKQEETPHELTGRAFRKLPSSKQNLLFVELKASAKADGVKIDERQSLSKQSFITGVNGKPINVDRVKKLLKGNPKEQFGSVREEWTLNLDDLRMEKD